MEVSTNTLAIGHVIGALLANPTHGEELVGLLNDQELELLVTIAGTEEVLRSNLDARRRNRLLEKANGLFSTALVGSIDPREVRSHLGNLGLLEPREYRVNVHDQVKKALVNSFLALSDVKNTVTAPDAFQHLHKPGDFHIESSLISIFVKLDNPDEVSSGAASPEWILVLASREGDRVEVTEAYRINAREITIDPAVASPLSLLTAFIDAYGAELSLGKERIGKFLLYKRLHSSARLGVAPGQSLGEDFVFRFQTRSGDDGSLEVAMAFYIDTSRYFADLRRLKNATPA